MSAQPANSRLARTTPWLGTGVVVSLLLHLVVGVMLVSSAAAELDLKASADVSESDRPDEPRLRLGLEESSIASINWLGFEDPTEHAAPDLFDLDQAALARDTATPQQALPTMLVDPTDPEQEAQANPPAELPAEADHAEQKTDQEPGEKALVEPLPAPAESSPVLIENPAQNVELKEASPASPEPETEGVAEPAEEESAEVTEQAPPESTQSKPATENSPTPPKPAVESETLPNPLAQADDRDAPPVAREVSLDFSRLGKPAAGEGVEIHTVRLDTQYKAAQFLAGSVRNPVAMIKFKREKEGPAIVATVDYERIKLPDGSIKVNDTGNSDIDRILRLNIYRWTATGKAIDELEIGKTLEIRLSINLH